MRLSIEFDVEMFTISQQKRESERNKGNKNRYLLLMKLILIMFINGNKPLRLGLTNEIFFGISRKMGFIFLCVAASDIIHSNGNSS